MADNFSQNEEFHREMLRKSKDIFMVYNPTDQDFVVTVDGQQGFDIVIPNKNRNIGFGNGKREVERWVMDLYRKHMVVNLINKDGDEKGRKELNDLEKANVRFKDKYEENTAVWNNQKIVPRTDNTELVEKYSDLVVLGLVREFGDEVAEQDVTAHQQRLDPIDKKIERITSKRYVSNDVDVPTLEQEPDLEPVLPLLEAKEEVSNKKKLEKELSA